MANVVEQQTINQLAELDFFKIRESLKTFLASQDRFKDYDFEGSNLSVLLDILSYTTHYKAFYLNMLSSEMFLDSTTRRAYTVARAKDLGYTPRSRRCSSATVVLTATPETGTPSTLTIPKGSKFKTDILGVSYVFQTTSPIVVTQAGGYQTDEIEIVEGKFLKFRQVVTNSNLNDGVTIPNANVDTSRLRVTVATTNVSNDDVEYQLVSDVIELNGNSLVYFLKETDNEKYHIRFGDGVLGKALSIGNQVTVEYYVSSGSVANGAAVFDSGAVVYDGVVVNGSITDVEVISASSGGGEIESMNSIKVNAPRLYQTQRRAVTAVDYSQIVKANYADIDSVTAWGGEDNVPIALGYVFVSIKPNGRLTLTQSEKLNVEEFLKENYCPLAIEPICVDPSFLYVVPNVTVRYDRNAVANSADVVSAVSDTIVAYTESDLNRFGEYFRYSKLLRFIDQSHFAITNSLMEITLRRDQVVVAELFPSSPSDGDPEPQLYRIDFFNTMRANTFISSEFDIFINAISTSAPQTDVYIKEVDGVLGYYKKVGTLETLLLNNIGTANAAAGIYIINGEGSDGFRIIEQSGTSGIETVSFYAEPDSFDIFPSKNLIVTIDTANTTITALPDVRPA